MRRRLLFLLLSIVATAVVLGLVFAGSPTTLAKRRDDRRRRRRRARTPRTRAPCSSSAPRALANRPVVFVAGGQRFAIRPAELGVEPDWKAAVDAAQRQGDGFGPIRGFRRLDVQVFGADVTPPTRVLNGALEYKLGLIARRRSTARRATPRSSGAA